MFGKERLFKGAEVKHPFPTSSFLRKESPSSIVLKNCEKPKSSHENWFEKLECYIEKTIAYWERDQEGNIHSLYDIKTSTQVEVIRVYLHKLSELSSFLSSFLSHIHFFLYMEKYAGVRNPKLYSFGKF